MAKRHTPEQKLKRNLDKEVKGVKPPRLEWKKTQDGHVPVIFIANIAIPLAPRPFQGFYRNEREAALVAIKQCLSEVIFGTAVYLVHPESGASAPNPDWDLQTFWVEDANNPGEYVEVEPQPSAAQVEAGNQLPIVT